MSDQMTLGKFIKALENCNQDAEVVFDFCWLTPTDFDSYRGYYEQLALGWEVDGKDMRCSDLLKDAKKAVGKEFHGYKGGEYNTQFEVGDEVLYLDPNDKQEPYMNGVVKDIVEIIGGPNRLNVLLDNGQYLYDNINKFVKVWKLKTQNTFKKGDRVIWGDRLGTLTSNKHNECYYAICLDKPYNGYQYFTVHEDTIKMNNTIKPLYKVGDRVRYDDNEHLDNGKYGIIKSIKNKNNDSVLDYVIELEPSGQILHTTDDLLILAKDQKPIGAKMNIKDLNIVENAYTIKCTKWYKSAYAAITKAGGTPDIVISSIPPEVLVNLIRNDLHLEYKK